MIKKNTPLLDRAALNAAADCLRVLAHPSRLQLIQRLRTGERYSVNDLADYCQLTQPATSDHLRLMQRCGFLTSERDGRTVYYRITEPYLNDIMCCVERRFGS